MNIGLYFKEWSHDRDGVIRGWAKTGELVATITPNSKGGFTVRASVTPRHVATIDEGKTLALDILTPR